MKLQTLKTLLCTLAAFGLLAFNSRDVQAADSPFVGTWKITIQSSDQDISAFLTKIEEKDGKFKVEMLSAGPNVLKGAEVKSVKVVDKSLHMSIEAPRIKLNITVQPSAENAKPRRLLGSVELGNQVEFVLMEESDLKELDRTKVGVPPAGHGNLVKAMRMTDLKQKQAALRKLIEKHSDHPTGYRAALELAASLAHSGAKEAEVRAEADKAIKAASAYGPLIKLQAMLQVTRVLLATGKAASLAVDYARQAEKMLTDKTSLDRQVAVLKVLRGALRQAGEKEALSDVQTRISKLDRLLDEEYAKTAVPFNPKRYPGRKTDSDRVVLLELFTGVQCPPCVAADVAFDALLKTYKPSDVVLLQYHVHIPGPDPLTNEDSEKCSRFYGVNSAPSLFINGERGPGVGGAKMHGRDRYETLIKLLDQKLETESVAKLQLKATRMGDKIDIQAEASDVKDKDDPVHLRLVLAEDTVRFAGRNGQRLHHNVVRAFPGGFEGLAVKDGQARQSIQVNLKDVEKALSEYLDKFAAKRKTEFEDVPLELKKLKVIAYLQNTKTKEVLQVAQVNVEE